MVFAYRLFVLGIDTRLIIGNRINFNLTGWFYLDNEKFFGSMFSTLMLLICACLMLIACIQARPNKRSMIGWAAISMMLLFLAGDEYMSFHERAFQILGGRESYAGSVPPWLPGALYGFLILAALMMIPITWFWWKLPVKLRLDTAVAGGVFILGALFVDEFTAILGLSRSDPSLSYLAMVSLEEGLEMLGVILLIRAMLLHLETQAYKRQSPVLSIPSLAAAA